MAFHEHHGRSLVKTVTYRALIIISNGAVVYWLTGNMDTTINITAVSTIISTAIYFLHERAWNDVHWGKSHLKTDQN